MEEIKTQNQETSIQIVFYMATEVQSYNKPAITIKFKEEGEYIADKDFDWNKILQFCEVHRRFLEKLCYQNKILKNFSVQVYVNAIEPVEPKRITPNSSLRLIKNQVKCFYSKYSSHIDRRAALGFSDIYDYIITGAPMPERLREQKIDDDKGFGKDF